MALIIAASVLFLDQLTKSLVTKYLSFNQSLPLIDGVLYLSLVHNRGAAFGMLKGLNIFFIFMALAAITLIYLNLRRLGWRRVTIPVAALSLILAGALGNLIDRLAFGYVIDFIDLRVWPVFNVADSAITIGALLWAFSIIKTRK
ncbi:MAG: signal peptidase II [Candidatus Omnitrophota bacterium]